MEIYLLVVVLIIAFLFAMALHHYKIKQKKILQIKGLSNLSHIKLLITLVQTHRGLSSALLNGDESKQNQLNIIKQQIQKENLYLEQQAPIKQNSRWSSFTDHWGRLDQVNPNRDPENSFKQHTQVIANLLYLLEDEAEHSQLNAMSLPEMPNIGYVWRELVATTETIGQSRAIGTGVATSKACSSVHKIRLSFLQQNIQKATDETLSKLPSLSSFKYKHSELLKVAKSKMELLSETIEQDLIASEKISINQNEYFELATDSIKALDNIFDSQVEQIKLAI